MNKQPLISFIIPCYNAQEYLEQCVNSVIGQTYSNLEIILVDDGSKDSTPKLCDSFAERDERVRVIHKQNSGASQARNSGLAEAVGDYIMFLDSDDWIEPETCARAISEATVNSSDVVIWSYVREFEGVSKPKLILGNKCTVYDKSDVWTLHRRLVGLYGEELFHPEQADSLITVWGKLYRRDVIANYKFVDMSEIGTEDVYFNIQVFGNVQSAVYIPECYSHYRKTNANSLSTAYTRKIFERWKRLFNRIDAYLCENQLPETYHQALRNRVSFCLIGLGINLAESSEPLHKKFSELGIVLNDPVYQNAIASLDFSRLPLKWKVFFVFAKHKNILLLYAMLFVIKFLRRR